MQTTETHAARTATQFPGTQFPGTRFPGTQFAGDDSFFLAGHTAPVGIYRLVGTDQEVRLDQEGDLPATCDGRVAVYERCPPTWAERQSEQTRNGS